MTEQQAAFYGELFQKLNLTELKIEEEGSSLLLKKEPVQTVSQQMNHLGAWGMQHADGTGRTGQEAAGDTAWNQGEMATAGSAASAAHGSAGKQYDEVKAPLLGIFHRAPSPSEPPFVEEGDAVKKGDVLCVIEAMKMMNEITAGRDGVIVSVCAEENAIVEYGQTIFEVQ
ncbi:MAG: biotin/lipoyl-containing protein [bacterium]|nr:biotin/lipoyl-containing protein [bacterium]